MFPSLLRIDVGVVSSNGQDFSRYEENVVLRGFWKIGSLEGSLNFSPVFGCWVNATSCVGEDLFEFECRSLFFIGDE